MMAEIGVAGAVVGIIIGGFSLTGLGAVLPQSMQALAGNNLFILLLLAAVAATILGMGAPPLLVYVLLVTTVAPAIIKMGVSPLAAHMFVFYFGLMSMLTPPVALCAMIAARVAGANFWRTAWEACRLAVVAYIVPFFFVYQPVLLFKGSAVELISAIVSSVIGVVALSGALTRYFFFRQLPLWEALLAGVGGLLLFYPGWLTDVAGLLLIAPPTAITLFKVTRQRQARSA